MPHLFVKPTRKLFLSICGCSLLLFLLFYLHATRLLERSTFNNSGGARIILRQDFFKNVTRTHVPDVCHRRDYLSKTTTSLVFVLSEPHSFKQRQVIRSGWGQKRISLLLRTSVLFVVGESRDLSTQLRLESEIFGDIIHTSFASSRAEKALNFMTAMRWASENCKRLNFIVKVTDDVFVNPFALERFLVQIQSQLKLSETHKNGTNPDKVQEMLTTVTLPRNQQPFPSANLRYEESHDPGSDLRSESSRELKQHDNLGKEARTVKPDQFYTEILKTHNSNEKQLKQATPNTNSISEEKSVVYCFVWRNVTMVKTYKSRWSKEDGEEKRDFSMNPPHCSPHGYILPVEASKLLINAYEIDYSDDIAHWASDFYVTGILANYAHIRHENIQDRYAFDMGDVDENSVFIPLGADSDIISGSVWKMIIEREEDMGNVNSG